MNEHQQLSWFTRKRIEWGGANVVILKKCPSEIPKYVGYGTTIFMTALMACLSGGYAIFSISDNIYAAFVFSPIWGMLIFTLDCAIIGSMRKPLIPSKSETIEVDEPDFERELETKRRRALRSELKIQQSYLFIVRFFVAILLGFIISMPLETLIFSKRIYIQWNTNKIVESNKALNSKLDENKRINEQK